MQPTLTEPNNKEINICVSSLREYPEESVKMSTTVIASNEVFNNAVGKTLKKKPTTVIGKCLKFYKSLIIHISVKKTMHVHETMPALSLCHT